MDQNVDEMNPLRILVCTVACPLENEIELYGITTTDWFRRGSSFQIGRLVANTLELQTRLSQSHVVDPKDLFIAAWNVVTRS